MKDMHSDLEWLARNVSEWPKWMIWARKDPDFPDGVCWSSADRLDYGYGWVTHYLWLQARKDLGLDPSGISEADEEECIQLAYERMNEESVKVSIEELQDNVNKPKHYQLREGYEVYDLRQDLAAKAANGGATYDQYSDWDRAIEYIIRMWGKNRLEDAKKGRWYLDKLIGKLEAQE